MIKLFFLTIAIHILLKRYKKIVSVTINVLNDDGSIGCLSSNELFFVKKTLNVSS